MRHVRRFWSRLPALAVVVLWACASTEPQSQERLTNALAGAGGTTSRDGSSTSSEGRTIAEPCSEQGEVAECSAAAGLVCQESGRSRTLHCYCESPEMFDFVMRKCTPAPLGSQPGDACSPGGEGDVLFAACDETRGLQCLAPEAGLLDAPSVCGCPEGHTFVAQMLACVDDELGQRPGDLCGPAGEGFFPWAPCNEARGLVCAAPDPLLLDAPDACECKPGRVWSEARASCVSEGETSCK